ncbi:MAG: hypothetical protein GF384_04890, partial [Elusimicrobia bacterium]|nr:hypothetical protein [Elusimicrobiota bacterium]
PFKSIDDFFMRIDQRLVNRKVIESLIKAGAFDCFGDDPRKYRAYLMAHIDELLDRTSVQQQEIRTGQGILFDLAEINQFPSASSETSATVEPWPEHTVLAFEKEVLGHYVSGHPLTKFEDDLKIFSSISMGTIAQQQDQDSSTAVIPGRVSLAGMICGFKEMVSKGKKQAYARFKLEGLDGEINVLVFPRSYTKEMAKKLSNNEMIVVTGRLNGAEEARELIAEDIMSFKDAREKLITRVVINVTEAGMQEPVLKNIKHVFSRFPGSSKVFIQLKTLKHDRVLIETEHRVKATAEFKQTIEKILGRQSLALETVFTT